MTKSASATGNRPKDADAFFQLEHRRICVRTDRLIAIIMCLQWPAAIAAAIWIAPLTWVGGTGSIHPHIVSAIYLGGLITILPMTLAFLRPGERSTRHVIAASQMLMSALLIHLTGGRIETHFHIFGSLAFLAFYLDWPVLVTATLVVLIHHGAMSYFNPSLIFGSAVDANWRFLEHVLWVVFIDTFLIRSCVQGLAGLRGIAQREADQGVLIHQAYHDHLTGLGNRLRLQEDVAIILEEAVLKPRAFALLAIDLDRFKEINDTLGHQTGDELLKEVAKRLQSQIRPQDTLVRMGGDEFTVVLPQCSEATQAIGVAARIIECLNQPFCCGENAIRVGASVGICLYPEAGREISELLHHADLALYKTKNNGRNGYQVFNESMRDETILQMNLEHRLRRAVAEEQFEIHFQPLVSTRGILLGFEALLRWNDPIHGRIAPADFIPLAEKTGLIIPIGKWVLRRACAQAAQWHRSGNSAAKMSVNISAVELAQKDFVSTVLVTLQETGLPPEFLDLELTERAILQDFEESRERLTLLRQLGIRLSIDDFGAGYSSSLNYLHELPVHSIKIDRSLVSNIENSAAARILIEEIIDMAHSLKLRVVAEGVENCAQMNVLSSAGCDEIQGFYISKAVPREAAELLLERIRGR